MDRKIRAFLAIVEEGTLTAAAERVALAQPSLTKLLKRLELELGAPLFERLPRGVVLTPFGERFHQRARTIEAEYRFAYEDLKAMRQGHVPVLNIGAGPLYHLLHIPLVLSTIVREFPQTRLNVVADINRVTMPMLGRGDLDVVCGELSHDEQIYGVDRIHLMDAEMGIIMRPGHPLADAPLDAARLAHQTFIIYQHDDRVLKSLERFMGHGEHPYTIALTTSSHATGLRGVSSSDYLMIGPAQLAPVIEDDGLIVRKPAVPIRQFATGIAVRRSGRAIPIVARLIDLLRDSTRRQVEAGGLSIP